VREIQELTSSVISYFAADFVAVDDIVAAVELDPAIVSLRT
jgi:hypothetical protein